MKGTIEKRCLFSNAFILTKYFVNFLREEIICSFVRLVTSKNTSSFSHVTATHYKYLILCLL